MFLGVACFGRIRSATRCHRTFAARRAQAGQGPQLEAIKELPFVPTTVNFCSETVAVTTASLRGGRFHISARATIALLIGGRRTGRDPCLCDPEGTPPDHRVSRGYEIRPNAHPHLFNTRSEPSAVAETPIPSSLPREVAGLREVEWVRVSRPHRCLRQGRLLHPMP